MLSQFERSWIAARLEQVERLQNRLDTLFQKAEGSATCAVCAGACCARGHNHAGLVNVLMFLQRGMAPPPVNFDNTCPWLSEKGCILNPGSRPYSCITFLCDKLEDHLGRAEVAEFYRLDRELRGLYHQFAERYAGGGMVGLLLQAERLAGDPLLKPAQAVTRGVKDRNQDETEL